MRSDVRAIKLGYRDGCRCVTASAVTKLQRAHSGPIPHKIGAAYGLGRGAIAIPKNTIGQEPKVPPSRIKPTNFAASMYYPAGDIYIPAGLS